MQPNFEHDCTADVLVGVIDGEVDIYAQCSGSGYTVRWGDNGPDYISYVGWTLPQAVDEAARIVSSNNR